MKNQTAFIFALLFALGCAASADDVIHGEDHFEFIYRVTLPQLDRAAEIWLPLAQSDAFQTVEIERISAPISSRKIEDRDFHNTILVFAPGPNESGKSIEIACKVSRREKASYAASGDAKRFLQPERLVPVNETFASIARDVARGKSDDLARARALYDHVLAQMKYDKTGTGWGRGDAVYACDARAGNCTDFHSYFIALARAAGIPARFAIGVMIPANENEGKISGYHCWAEFFADGKWVPVDISEARKNPALADYYFGHNPANRFELSRGRDLVTVPEPASGPINFLVHPLLEIGGQPVKLDAQFSFHRIQPAPPESAQTN